MKTLALLRHAKSSWDKSGLSDFDRPLKRRGREAAERMGARLRELGSSFDLVLASPARRVVETLAHLERGYGEPLPTRLDRGIYDASSDVLLKLIQGVDDEVQCLMLVGHNPGLQTLAKRLACSRDDLFDRVADHYPTAALALLEMTEQRWLDIKPGNGRLTAFVKPREL